MGGVMIESMLANEHGMLENVGVGDCGKKGIVEKMFFWRVLSVGWRVATLMAQQNGFLSGTHCPIVSLEHLV
jgi:hypothetical protein